ncbi:MAG: family 10 glycosylhydrolase [Clostridiales bacterium]|nr:family 10 glycosylhydrolase [Clostridiales bacterium]
MTRHIHTIIALLSLLLATSSTARAAEPVKREMRGVWVATIYGLDWPSTRGTDKAAADAQKASMIKLLDRMHDAGMNAVMFQVRTYADAMYRSQLEPWSSYLTGTRGVAPHGEWDPLQFCIEQCHARGMECHAWVNPFRYSTQSAAYTDKYAAKMKPLLLTYTQGGKTKKGRKGKRVTTKGKTTVILDPGNPKAREHVVNVCRDIVTRYDIDGLVFDDYFYPDRLPLGRGIDFNEWKESGSKLSQADWRRENVNITVKAVHDMLQETKPWVQFGIAPAGVGGGNGVASGRYGLPSCTGNDWMYDRIFCDPLAWLEQGSVDYISPQIYWNRDHKTNPYGPIACWWSDVARHFGRHFYGSLSLSQFAAGEGDNPKAWKERSAQIDINRREAHNNAPGAIHYAARNINGFGKHLASGNYSHQALVPAREWYKATDPGAVRSLRVDGKKLKWDAVKGQSRYTVYAVPGSVDIFDAMSVNHGGISAEYLLGVCYDTEYEIPADKRSGYRYLVAVLDRHGNEWEAVEVK